MKFLTINLKLISFLGIAVCPLLQFATFAQGFPPANVNVVPAEIRSLAPVSWVSGTVVSRNNSQISSEVAGRLIELIDLGSKVTKGMVIAKVDKGPLLIKQQEYLASVESAKSLLKFLESEVKRKTTLAKRNLSSETSVDEALSKRDAARGALAEAKANLAQTEQDLAYSQVKAPFDGMVTQRLSNLGEFIDRGTSILMLVETENLEASVYAPLTTYRFLTQHASLAVDSPLGTSIVPIKTIVPIADKRSHLMQVRLDMSALDWPIGLTIKAAIANGVTKEALSVPRDALVLRREGITIFRINSDDTAEKISVKVGIGAGSYVEVIGDVQPGDRIVIRGAERLMSGQKVHVKQNNDSLVSGL